MPHVNKSGQIILECCQEIPCNPCTTVCKTGAITKDDLNACPTFHPEKCVGCMLCVAACPGQAIFFEVPDDGAGHATITFPYEYLPLPTEGQTVTAVNRMGLPACQARVRSVEQRSAYNRTVLVTLEIPVAYRDDVRFMKRLDKGVR